jgi:hypothetical protein
LSELNPISQAYLVSLSDPRFGPEKDILRFDPKVPMHARHLARRRDIIDGFRDFHDYLLDDKVDLGNGAVLAALNLPE